MPLTCSALRKEHGQNSGVGAPQTRACSPEDLIVDARVVVCALLSFALRLNMKDVAHENEDSLDEQTIVLAPVFPVLRKKWLWH